MPPAKRKASEISDTAHEVNEPLLSHAEQRRQKKKQKQNDGDGEKPTKKSDPIAKRQNSVWVGNLAFKTTPVSLKAFFEGVGEITRINMPLKTANGKGPRENSGFAYVDFATNDAKVVAMTMSERNLEGRRLLIKDGDDYSTRPGGPPKGEGLSKTAQKILNSQTQPPGPTLFFGNLSFQTTEQSIIELLEAHKSASTQKGLKHKEEERREKEEEVAIEGEKDKRNKKDLWIRKVRLGTFEDTGVCKGWAFVDFTTTENATAALVNPRNHTLDGRKLKVEYASADAVRRGGGPGEHRHPKKEEHKDGQQKHERERRDAVDDKDPHEKELTSEPIVEEGEWTQKGVPSRSLRPRVLAPAKRSTGDSHKESTSEPPIVGGRERTQKLPPRVMQGAKRSTGGPVNRKKVTF